VCILCHYRSDNKLVTHEQRAAAPIHNGIWQCVRQLPSGRYYCVDCSAVVEGPEHVCGKWSVVVGPIAEYRRVYG